MTTKIKTHKKPKPEGSRFSVPAEEPWPDRINELQKGSLDGAPPVASEPASPASDFFDVESASLPTTAPMHPKVTKPEWCMFVCPFGEFPSLVIYTSLEAMAKRLRTLEGQDMAVFPFYGVPVPFTRGPCRFLRLPDGQLRPLFDLSAFGTFVANPLSEPPIDSTYYLGPEELSDVAPPSAVIDHRPAIANVGGKEQTEETATVSSSRDKGRKGPRKVKPATAARSR
jgi:hypothetical protein